MIARAALLLGLCACPSPRHPTPPVGAVTLAIGRDGASLRGVAGDGTQTFAALSAEDKTTIVSHSARRGMTSAWSVDVGGHAGPLAVSGDLVAATLGGKQLAGETLRGDPGAMVYVVDAKTGVAKWQRAIDASESAVITAIAPYAKGFVVGGSFAGTLRAGDKSVSSGGKSDGFVARLDENGNVAWLTRVGGVGVDAVLGVATRGDRIAIAGTFAPGADLQGTPLEAIDPKTPRADGFVAELDGKGARTWSQSFGGKLDDSVVGVAIDGTGRVAVAASAREVMRFGSTEIVAMGDADGALAWWTKDGVPGATVQIGGPDFDGVRAIAAVGNRIVVGGFFSGTIRIDQRKLTAGGGDDAFIAAFENGALRGLWPVTGEGREEIAALSAMPGGFIAGITHTARADVEGAKLAAPKDALSGAALVIRPVQ